MNITSMSGRELYQTLAGRDISCGNLLNEPCMKDKIKAVYPSNRDTFTRDKDGIDGSSVTSLFETASPIRLMLSQGMSTEELAEHFGGIGKRLDEAYSQGKFTEEEYDELNAGLDEYIEKMTAKSERMNAVWETAKENLANRRQGYLMAGVVYPKGDTRTVSEIQEEINSRVNNYVKNVSGIDRELLLTMINRIRYGK